MKQAAAGLERLFLQDEDRRAHTDAAAFLTAYLLGLPVFSYKCDANSAFKLLQISSRNTTENTIDVLNCYRQPLRSVIQNPARLLSSSINENNNSDDKMEVDIYLAKITSVNYKSKNIPNSSKSLLLDYGRVLVWLLAPVAAEQSKYGQMIYSDPRRCVLSFTTDVEVTNEFLGLDGS